MTRYEIMGVAVAVLVPLCFLAELVWQLRKTGAAAKASPAAPLRVNVSFRGIA